MPIQPRLGAGDRNFFSLVSRIIYMNPFHEERAAILDRLTAGKARGPGEPGIDSILPEVDARIASLDKKGLGTAHATA